MKNIGIGRRLMLAAALLLFAQQVLAAAIGAAGSVSLNGTWESGFARHYDSMAAVPGISQDPTVMKDEPLWFRREITLPEGSWTAATLELKGARFQPKIYVDGELVASANGGMTPIFVTLAHKRVRAGAKVVLELELGSLKHMDRGDASYIPIYDHWRSNVSSGLWDDVVLHLHGDTSVARIIPSSDHLRRTGSVKLELAGAEGFKGTAMVRIVDQRDRVLVSASAPVDGSRAEVTFKFGGRLRDWSPDDPQLYRLKLDVTDSRGKLQDQRSINYAVKTFEVRDKQFYLNGSHFVPRGPSVTFQRWVRTREGRELAYDEAWFVKNIIERTKRIGGNYLRLSLGGTPERLLDLCDRYGLVVQYEWSFFHGMPASKESLLEQYKNWLDLGVRHPSVSLIHPYNETEGKELETAWAALDELLPAYPKMVLADRDVVHVHKYWWSLFENLGLFYDDAKVFPTAIMVDEFGGNYLDQRGDAGSYPMVKESLLRFLGRENTAAERLAFQADANAKVAEYWRRIGAAGFSPFTALGSDQDGSNWFLGPLKEGNPMPVWKALTAAFSPQSASIELWDRNFTPGQALAPPVYLFNDKREPARLAVRVTIEDPAGKVLSAARLVERVGATSKTIRRVPLKMPAAVGDYVVKAELLNPPAGIQAPVVSSWQVRVLSPETPAGLRKLKVALAADEAELRRFLAVNGIASVELGDPEADLVLTSAGTWRAIAAGDAKLADTLQAAIAAGKSVVMLDVGDRPLGQGYPKQSGDLGPLQGVVQVANPETKVYPLFGGMTVKLTQAAEPESHIHPDRASRALWSGLPDQATRLWNGMRGGLIAPAEDLELTGLSSGAFTTQWTARGADEARIKQGAYFAYELQGFFEFSGKADDKAIEKQIKDKVRFLVRDAPALAISINPNSPVMVTDLGEGYKLAARGTAKSLAPLANSGKNLTRTPVVKVDFGPGKGKLIVSQLLTAGRLADGFGEPGLYGIRYDPAAVQLVLNMLALSVAPAKQDSALLDEAK